MSKHSIRIGSDSRLSTSRSSSSASTRRARFVSATNVSDCSASTAFCCASSWSRRFSPRSGARTSTCEPRRDGEERLERRGVPHAARHQDLRRDRRGGAVVLEAEPLEHLVELGARGVLEVERVAIDHPPFAQREHLHRGALGRDRDPEHVDRPDRLALDRLALRQAVDRAEAVAVARRVLEPLLARRQAHLLLEPPPDRAVVPRQELDHLVDQLAVVLLRDVADAGREAALDVEVEARDPAVAAGLRPLARAVAEHAVQHVERLAHLLRVRVRPEVDDAAAMPLSREHDAREVVLDRDRDVRERLVVTQAHVVRRPVALDEVLLEVQRLDLRAGDDRLDLVDALGHLPDPRPRVGRAGLEVRADARAQRLRLADVQDVAFPVSEQVDAGRRRRAASAGR